MSRRFSRSVVARATAIGARLFACALVRLLACLRAVRGRIGAWRGVEERSAQPPSVAYVRVSVAGRLRRSLLQPPADACKPMHSFLRSSNSTSEAQDGMPRSGGSWAEALTRPRSVAWRRISTTAALFIASVQSDRGISRTVRPCRAPTASSSETRSHRGLCVAASPPRRPTSTASSRRRRGSWSQARESLPRRLALTLAARTLHTARGGARTRESRARPLVVCSMLSPAPTCLLGADTTCDPHSRNAVAKSQKQSAPVGVAVSASRTPLPSLAALDPQSCERQCHPG
eukprot:6184304-Pleurochrysis_carterae.AAC.4